MTELDDLRVAESAVYSSLSAAMFACERLAIERESIPQLVETYRVTQRAEQHLVERFAETLHPTEPELAKALLPQLSGTMLGKLILEYGPRLISRYRF